MVRNWPSSYAGLVTAIWMTQWYLRMTCQGRRHDRPPIGHRHISVAMLPMNHCSRIPPSRRFVASSEVLRCRQWPSGRHNRPLQMHVYVQAVDIYNTASFMVEIIKYCCRKSRYSSHVDTLEVLADRCNATFNYCHNVSSVVCNASVLWQNDIRLRAFTENKHTASNNAGKLDDEIRWDPRTKGQTRVGWFFISRH